MRELSFSEQPAETKGHKNIKQHKKIIKKNSHKKFWGQISHPLSASIFLQIFFGCYKNLSGFVGICEDCRNPHLGPKSEVGNCWDLSEFVSGFVRDGVSKFCATKNRKSVQKKSTPKTLKNHKKQPKINNSQKISSFQIIVQSFFWCCHFFLVWMS